MAFSCITMVGMCVYVCDKKDALCAINKSLYAVKAESSSINQWSGGNIRAEFNWRTEILRDVRR